MESLESNLLALLKLRQKSRSTELTDDESARLAALELEIGKYSGKAVLDALTRPGVPGTVWPLVR
jgi:hypothetical protein